MAGLVVTWNPDGGFAERLARLAPQVDRLLVIDNGSSPVGRQRAQSVARLAGAECLENPSNRGVAAAYNQGARWAREAGCEWILIVDQDSRPTENLVAELQAAQAAHFLPESVAVVGPIAGVQRDDRRCAGKRWARRRLVISSGSLINLDVWKRAGGFRADYFVDMVEAEYCLRVGSMGYRVILACRATLHHRIGLPTYHTRLGLTVSTSNHPAWRRYYLMRNRWRTWRTYWRQAPAWVAFDVFGHVRDTIKMALLEDDRRAKLAAVRRGLRDGMRGRHGLVMRPDGWARDQARR